MNTANKIESEKYSPDFRLDGKIAIITGASKGIGEGLSYALASAGAKVALLSRNIGELRTVAEKINSQGGVAKAYQMDLSAISSIRTAIEKVYQDFGRIDILVNNAGLGFNHAALDITENDWDEMMDVNLKGLFFCCQVAGKIMLEQKCGSIVNMSSQASVVAIKNHAVYCTGKGGVNQLTKVLALEWAEQGVKVNAVSPTFIQTPGTAERLADPDFHQSVVDQIPMGKVGEIKDVAGAVIYLASAASSMVTGQNLLVDGGWTIL